MDKKERVKKFDENLTTTFAVIGMLAVGVLLLMATYRVTFFAPAFLIITPFVSLYLVIKGFDIYSPKDACHIIISFVLISFFCALSISNNNGKHEAYIKKMFYGGEVKAKEGFVEGDGAETIDHYETYYVHRTSDGKQIKAKFLHLFLEYLPWLAMAVNFFLFTRASKKYNPD